MSDKKRAELYSKCKAYINPQKEDFGITIVEAMASGRPVIAFGQGGATETVVNNKTGIFFNTESSEAIVNAVKKFNNIEFNPQEIHAHAMQFSKKQFKENIENFIKDEYKKFNN